jgi:hypothetical protein
LIIVASPAVLAKEVSSAVGRGELSAGGVRSALDIGSAPAASKRSAAALSDVRADRLAGRPMRLAGGSDSALADDCGLSLEPASLPENAGSFSIVSGAVGCAAIDAAVGSNGFAVAGSADAEVVVGDAYGSDWDGGGSSSNAFRARCAAVFKGRSSTGAFIG